MAGAPSGIDRIADVLSSRTLKDIFSSTGIIEAALRRVDSLRVFNRNAGHNFRKPAGATSWLGTIDWNPVKTGFDSFKAALADGMRSTSGPFPGVTALTRTGFGYRK